MTYSIYGVWGGDYIRGKYLVGGFKTKDRAIERGVEIMNTLSRNAKTKFEIVNNKTKKSVGWIRNGWMWEIGIYWEDLDGNVKLIMR